MTHAPYGSPASDEVVAQWDALAPLRREQIESGIDITYQNFLIPQMEAIMGDIAGCSVLDAGCGVGFFSRRLSMLGADIIGLDPSSKSIAIAKEVAGGIDLRAQSLEEYAGSVAGYHDTVVANMVLMDVLNVPDFLAAARRVLKPSGRLVFSITHPWFWPRYSGYAEAEWFNYSDVLAIKAPFALTLSPQGTLISTHVHRPLEHYLTAFEQAGFATRVLREPMPDADVAALYPEAWEFPRFLFGVLAPY